MIHRINKLKDVSITPAMTLSEIAQSLEDKEDSLAASYATGLRDYEALRYNEPKRTDENVREIKAKFQTILKLQYCGYSYSSLVYISYDVKKDG